MPASPAPDPLAEARALLATTGPDEWQEVDGRVYRLDQFGSFVAACHDGRFLSGEESARVVATAQFIAAAPRLLRALVQRVERAEARAERAISEACSAECSCGGSGPNDEKACPACRVYHAALRAYRQEAT